MSLNGKIFWLNDTLTAPSANIEITGIGTFLTTGSRRYAALKLMTSGTAVYALKEEAATPGAYVLYQNAYLTASGWAIKEMRLIRFIAEPNSEALETWLAANANELTGSGKYAISEWVLTALAEAITSKVGDKGGTMNGTTWVFNDALTVPDADMLLARTQSAHFVDLFTSNGVTYYRLDVDVSEGAVTVSYVKSGTTETVYTTAGGWANDAFKTVVFVNEPGVTYKNNCCPWFTKNATPDATYVRRMQVFPEDFINAIA